MGHATQYRRVPIGMTRDMVAEMLRKPQSTNGRLLLESVRDEWLYGSGLSLYFDDGILTGYQQDR